MVEGTDYTKQTPSKDFTEKKSMFKTPKMKKNHEMCTKEEVHIFNE